MTPNALMLSSAMAGKDVLSRECDERLVELAQAGSTGAFEQLVDRHRRPLLAYCRRFLPPERAEDVVQLIFMRAYERIDQFQGDSALRAWLYRVAHNSAIDALRDRDSQHSGISESIDGVERPDQAFEKHERMRDTVIAIQALPANQRDAVVLREFEGRSYDEISTSLGVTRSATRQLLARARNTLRANVAALIPAPLLKLGSSSSNALSARAADLCASGGTVVTQIGVGTLVTGSLAAGALIVPAIPGAGGPETPAATAQTRQAYGSSGFSPSARFSPPTAKNAERRTKAPAALPHSDSPSPPRTLKVGSRQERPVPAVVKPAPAAVKLTAPMPTGGEADGKTGSKPRMFGRAVPGYDGEVPPPTCVGAGCPAAQPQPNSEGAPPDTGDAPSESPRVPRVPHAPRARCGDRSFAG